MDESVVISSATTCRTACERVLGGGWRWWLAVAGSAHLATFDGLVEDEREEIPELLGALQLDRQA
jgi:hypothetical protein